MNIDRAVMTMAGTITLIGVTLAAVFSTWWLLVPAFVGLNLLQASVTGFCPAATLFRRIGLEPGPAFR
jgi:hypothetical protein